MESWVYTPPSNLAVYTPPPPAPVVRAGAAFTGQPAVSRPLVATGLRLRDQKDGTPLLGGVLVRLVSAGVLGYHGYRRSRGSMGWAAGYAAIGFASPVIGALIAGLQGFGKRKAED